MQEVNEILLFIFTEEIRNSIASRIINEILLNKTFLKEQASYQTSLFATMQEFFRNKTS